MNKTSTEEFKINDIQSENTENEKGNIQSSESNYEITDETVDDVSKKRTDRKNVCLTHICSAYI